MTKYKFQQANMTADDKAVVTSMAEFPLKKGQMLLLGPQSIAVLTGKQMFTGKLVDKVVIEKPEWNK